MTGSGNNTFQSVLSDLDATAQNANTLMGPIGDLRTVVDDASSLVRDIKKLFTEYGKAVDAVLALQVVCNALEEVPFVDAVAGVASTVLSKVYDAASTFRNDVVIPLSKDVDSVHSALLTIDGSVTTLQTVINDIATKLPDVTNTIAILNVLTEIATPLTQALQGAAAADRLAALIKDYDVISDDVSDTLEPVTKAIAVISGAVAGVVSQLQRLLSVGSVVRTVRQALGNVSDILDPIDSAIRTLEGAIAPVKWALDAAACIRKKVFEPIVNEVLEATGLEGLVNGLEAKLESAIGIADITNALANDLGAATIGKAVSALAPDALAGGWPKLVGALGKYSTNKNAVTRQAMSDLISAISGSQVDPSKPAVIPDWPSAPAVSLPGAELPAPPRQWFAAGDATAVPAVASLAAVAGMTRSAGSRPPRSPAPTGIAGVDRLSSAVGDAVALLGALDAKATALSQALDAAQTSLSVPSSFGAEVQAIQAVLGTGAAALEFLASLDLFKHLLAPVAGVLQSQAASASSLSTQIGSLQAAVTAIETALQPVLGHVPSRRMIATVIGQLQGWAAGAGSMVVALRAGAASAPTPPQQRQLASQRALVDSKAATVAATVEQITGASRQIEVSLEALTTALQGYVAALQAITQHDHLIARTALPSLAHVTHILTAVEAIFDPLEALLVDLGCTDAGNSMKSGANATRQAVVSAMQAASSPGLNFVVHLLTQFEERLVPLPALLADVQHATTLLSSTALPSVISAGSTLIGQLDTLRKLLAADLSYSVTFEDSHGASVTQSVQNAFLAAGDARAAIDLTNSIATH